jgi:hypothetical protein
MNIVYFKPFFVGLDIGKYTTIELQVEVGNNFFTKLTKGLSFKRTLKPGHKWVCFNFTINKLFYVDLDVLYCKNRDKSKNCLCEWKYDD